MRDYISPPSTESTPQPSHVRHRGGLPGGVLLRVRTYIDSNLGEHISLNELARHAGVSRFHFARQFRRSTGESPMGYLRRERIERSKHILQRQQATVAQVAAMLGFADQSHFTRTFGRIVGVPPGRFAVGGDRAAADTSCRSEPGDRPAGTPYK